MSIVFNIGPGGFQGSTFLRKFMAGDPKGCADAILMWKKPAEIIPRRQAEADQFLTPYAKALPKARRTDRTPIAAPAVAKPAPAPQPDPLAPMTGKSPSPAESSPPKLPSQPAPTGGLVRSGAQATGSATRGLLNSLFAGIHNALARKV